MAFSWNKSKSEVKSMDSFKRKESNLITKLFAERVAHPSSSTNTKNPFMSQLKQYDAVV